MSQSEKNIAGEKKSFSEKLSSFIIKFRVPILSLVVVLLVAAIGVGVFFSINESTTKKGLTEVDLIENSLTEACASLSGEELTAKETDLYAKAEALAGSNKNNVTAVRAYLLMAEIKFSAGDFAAAKDMWLNAAENGKKSYTYGLSYYQASVCAEELKDFDKAIEYLKIAADSEDFPVKQRAIFNIGRIDEQRGNYKEAAEQYQELVASYPNDAWASLAKTRLLQLSIDGKAN